MAARVSDTTRLFPVLLVAAAVTAVALPATGGTAATRRPLRLRLAEKRHSEEIRARLQEIGVAWPPSRAFIRVFKYERSLELWVADRKGPFALFREYPVCAASGVLGPKRRQGDLQVPEGYYKVTVFNPYSRYHLSLSINYPNASDRRLGLRSNLGGSILIHGKCVSIGCISVLDDEIEEIYLVSEAAAAKRGGISVHIFPTRLDEPAMATLSFLYGDRPDLVVFWRSLVPGYRGFEETRTVPVVTLGRDGYYR
jgi:murein L,D-transpeptidase YafK